MDSYKKRKHHRTSPQSSSASSSMAEETKEQAEPSDLPIQVSQSFWFTRLISFQADIIYTCILALFSPFQQPQETKQSLELSPVPAHHNGGDATSNISLFFRRIGLGFLSAAYVCMALVGVMVLAVILGVGLVRFFVEEPVFMRESLQFDYSDVHPSAVLAFRGGGGEGGYYGNYKEKSGGGVPVGHTFSVSLSLLMPESDYNREVGMFQLTAELIARNGAVTAKSSHPCMLKFRSWPIRAMRTFFMAVPILLGLTAETQRITISMLKHKEGFPRTEAIRISMIPRAGTYYLPQVYEAEIYMKSQLPWKKALIHQWRWTFYVWTSFNIYILLLIVLFCFFKPLIFPVMTIAAAGSSSEHGVAAGALGGPKGRDREDRDLSETLRRWHQSRNKRKAMLLQKSMLEPVGSTASSITFTKEEDYTSSTLDEDTGDSESVCFSRGTDD